MEGEEEAHCVQQQPFSSYYKKVLGLSVLAGLLTTGHSLARSHYWPTRGLLAAGCPPWPSPPLLRQPDPLQLPGEGHVDAGLSADAGSTWTGDQQDSLPQVIPQNLPPSSWITRARHGSRRGEEAGNSRVEKPMPAPPLLLAGETSLQFADRAERV